MFGFKLLINKHFFLILENLYAQGDFYPNTASFLLHTKTTELSNLKMHYQNCLGKKKNYIYMGESMNANMFLIPT